MNDIKVQNIVCIIASLILLGMTIVSAVTSSGRLTYEIVTGLFCALFCLVPILLRRLKLITLPTAFIIMAEIAVFLHAYGVLLMRYDFVPMWDTVTHTISSAVVAMIVFYGVQYIEMHDSEMHATPKMIHVYIFLITMTFSVIWEVFEIFSDAAFGIHMQYSPFDTIRDFTCDAAGAAIVILFSHFSLKKHDIAETVNAMHIHPMFERYVSRHSGKKIDDHSEDNKN